MKMLTSEQMGEVDRLSTEIYRIPSILLMESAGRSLADELRASVSGLNDKDIQVFCGKGNNGGDGFVAARYLHLRGAVPQVVLFADPKGLRGDALTNWNIIESLGVPLKILPSPAEAKRYLKSNPVPDIVVDALFGTGLSKPIGPEFKHVVDWINKAGDSALVVSVDIPSGLFANSSGIPGPVVRARLTVTFTALKPALVLPPAASCAGRVVVAPIGSPARLLENPEYQLNVIDPRQVRRALPVRARDSHKGTYGHVYVIAGSRGKSGAALMTGMAALRSGAGLVTLWLAESLNHDVVGKFPELMTEPLPETSEGTIDIPAAEKILSQADQADALVVGPGLTTHRAARRAIREIVRGSPVPVILDADGINAYASDAASMRNDTGHPVIITPHPGEMARLLELTIGEVQKKRLETAQGCARDNGCFAILKGYRTLVATPSGEVYVNCTGNPGMATGGSGDILAGMMGRFVAGWNRKYVGNDLRALADYLSAAVYLHGMAGDLAAEQMGEESMIATDLIPHLPAAFKTLRDNGSARDQF
ncbi:MAG TPA: NAD(P)H-hydrate dehydratase, partial [Acidobacteriota bacterium]|nr:NAD(P)H-hydrate dehydratase [Acidobacteriota bacterium]